MPLSDDVRMIFSAQNMAGPEIERLVATLDAFDQGAGVATEAFAQLEAGAARQAQTLLSLDSAYGRVVASSEAMRSVQEQITTGLLSGTAAADAQAAAMGRLEAATASYLGAGQRAAAAAADPRINPVGGVGRAGYGPEYVPGMLVAPFDLNDPATYPAGTRVLTPAEHAIYNAQLASTRAQGLLGNLNETGTLTTPITREPSVAATGAERGLLGGIGEQAGQALKYSLLYGGVGAGIYALGQSVQGANQFDLTQASTQATTGISTADLQQIVTGIKEMTASGKSYYDQNQLLEGAYSVISTGITQPQAVLATLRAAAQGSTAALAPDVTTASGALTTVLNAYGVPTAQQAGAATHYESQILEAINLGKVDPTQVPGAIGTFALSAAQARVPFGESTGLFAFSTLATRSAQQSAEDVMQFYSDVVNPNAQQRLYAGTLGIQMGPQALAQMGTGGFIQHVLERTAGPNQQLFIERLFNQQSAQLIEQAAQQPDMLQQYLQKTQGVSPGYAATAAGIVESSGAGTLQGAVDQLKTEFQDLGTTVLPALTLAAQGAASALNVIGGLFTGPGGKGGLGASVAGALDTLGFFLNPTSSDFGNLDKARADAAKQMQSTQQAQADSLRGLSAPLYEHGMPIVAAAPDSSLYQQYGDHPYSAAEYAQYGNAAQRATYGSTQGNTTLQQRTSMALLEPALYAQAVRENAAHDTLFWLSGMTGGMGASGGRGAPVQAAAGETASSLTMPQLAIIHQQTRARQVEEQAQLAQDQARTVQLATRTIQPRGQTELGRAESDLQAQLRTAELQGNLGLSSQLAQTLIAFERTNQQQLGLSSAQLGLNVEQIQHGLSRVGGATIRDATGPTLIRPTESGFTDPRAAYGQALARIAGDEGERRQLQLLEQQVAAAHKTIEQQARQIQDDSQIIAALKAIARNTSPRAGDITRPIPRNVSGGHPSL